MGKKICAEIIGIENVTLSQFGDNFDNGMSESISEVILFLVNQLEI